MKSTEDTDKPDHKKRDLAKAALIALPTLALGIFVLWVIRSRLGIEGDASFLAVLLLPIFTFLVVAGLLEEWEFGPFKGRLSNQLTELKKTVTETTADEQRLVDALARASGDPFAVVYGDIDNLRRTTRDQFMSQGISSKNDKLQSESRIRASFIETLVIVLAHAVHTVGESDLVKYDIFELPDPDVVLILRSKNAAFAQRVAEVAASEYREVVLARDLYRSETQDIPPLTVTFVVADNTKLDERLPAVDLHRTIRRGLKRIKSLGGRGTVHVWDNALWDP